MPPLSTTTVDHLPEQAASFLERLEADTAERLSRLVGDVRGWAAEILVQSPPIPPFFFRGPALHALSERKGRGGFAEAWTVNAEGKPGPVIGKFLHGQASTQSRFRSSAERMRTEAAILERIDAPGVPKSEGGGDIQGTPYLLMEYIEGRSWRELTQRKPGALPLPLLLRCGLEVTETLAALHAQGIVHSDLKPENVMFGRTADTPWRTWIVDFGLAVDTGSATTRVTTEGQTVGTHGFLDPRHVERALDRDKAGDIYALGATFYEWYAGTPLFSQTEWRNILLDASGFDAHVRAKHAAFSRLPPAKRHAAFEALLLEMLLYELPDRPRPSALMIASRLRKMMSPGRNAAQAETMEAALKILEEVRGPTRRNVLLALGGLAIAGTAAMLCRQPSATPSADTPPRPEAPQESPKAPPALRLIHTRDEVRLEIHGLLALQKKKSDAMVFTNTLHPDNELWSIELKPEELCNALERMKPGSSSGLPRRPYACYLSRVPETSLLMTPRGVVHDDGKDASFASLSELESGSADIVKRHLMRWPAEGKLIDRMTQPEKDAAEAQKQIQKANDYLRALQQKAAVRPKLSRSSK